MEKGVFGYKVSAVNRDAIIEIREMAEKKPLDVFLVKPALLSDAPDPLSHWQIGAVLFQNVTASVPDLVIIISGVRLR